MEYRFYIIVVLKTRLLQVVRLLSNMVNHRLPLVILAFLAYLSGARSALGRLDAKAWLVGLCFSALCLHVYLYNMCCDMTEDAVNIPDSTLQESSHTTALWFSWF